MRATPPSRADVGRHALERHHGDGAGVLGDPRLLGVVTSMITPPLSISARPLLTRIVPISAIARILVRSAQAAPDVFVVGRRGHSRPHQHHVALGLSTSSIGSLRGANLR